MDSLVILGCNNPSNGQKIQKTAHFESERLLCRLNECTSLKL